MFSKNSRERNIFQLKKKLTFVADKRRDVQRGVRLDDQYRRDNKRSLNQIVVARCPALGYFVTLPWKRSKFRAIKPAVLVATNLTGGRYAFCQPPAALILLLVASTQRISPLATLMSYELLNYAPPPVAPAFITLAYTLACVPALSPFFCLFNNETKKKKRRRKGG